MAVPSKASLRETDLYPPVKAFLEAQGYVVRAEVGACDVVAVRGDEPPVIVELKRAFGLAVLHQAVARQAVSDAVYVAVAVPDGRARQRGWERGLPDTLRLCRLLGLGLLSVRPGAEGAAAVEPLLDPGPYRPRAEPRRRERLLREFARRHGDHNIGGSTGRPIVTAYRKYDLRCADLLAAEGALAIAEIRRRTGIAAAGTLLQRDPYGWFARIGRGTYTLTETGRAALGHFAPVVAQLRGAEAPAP